MGGTKDPAHSDAGGQEGKGKGQGGDTDRRAVAMAVVWVVVGSQGG